MTDFSIDKASSKRVFWKKHQKYDSYQSLKQQYDVFVKKALKSDFSNAPTLVQSQLEMLLKMKEAAEKEGLTSEVENLTQQIESLSIIAEKSGDYSFGNAFYYPVESKTIKPKVQDTLNACKNSKGEIDEETKRIVLAFGDVAENAYQLSYLVKKCRDDEEKISEDTIKAVEILGSAKIEPNFVAQVLDEFKVATAENVEEIDLKLCDRMAKFKLLGLDDIDALNLTRRLSSEYENYGDVYSSVSKFLSVGISSEKSATILSKLSRINPETGKYTISKKAVNSIVSLKKNLSMTRANEQNERENPINKKGVVRYDFGDMTLVLRDNRVIKISQTGEETVYSTKKAYNELVSNFEDDILVKFVDKYKQENGEINQNAHRVITALRNQGITYGELLNLTEYCLNDGKINSISVENISKLKEAGALSVDIPLILNDEIGELSERDLAFACKLTSSVIEGKKVAEFLSKIKGNEEAEDFVEYFSDIFENKNYLTSLLYLINPEEQIDENAISVIYNLADVSLFKDEPMDENQFINYVTSVITKSKSENEVLINDDVDGICSIMSKKGETPEHILVAITACKDENGVVNETLGDILWEMYRHNAIFTDIIDAINVCKSSDNTIDSQKTKVLMSLLEDGYNIDDVMSVVNNMRS